MTTNHAVVFGGSGFIGTHLVQHLQREGRYERITIADVVPPPAPVPGVEHATVDVRRPIPADIVDGAARPVLYNLAAVHRTPGHPEHEYYETNVLGAVNICDFANRVGARDILFTSSIAVYGPGEERKTETTPPTPESAYGWSKLMAEEVQRSWHRLGDGRRLTVVRPAVIFGRGERGNFTRLAQALSRGTFVYVGRRDTIKACGYVEDLVHALEFMHARGEPETMFNFSYPRAYTIEEICEAFHRVGALRRPLGTAPLPVLNLAARGFEVLDGLGLRNSVSRDRIQKLVRSTHIEPTVLATAAFPYATDLEEGLRRWRVDNAQGRFA